MGATIVASYHTDDRRGYQVRLLALPVTDYNELGVGLDKLEYRGPKAGSLWQLDKGPALLSEQGESSKHPIIWELFEL